MFRSFILKHEKKIHRGLEILPGFFSWNVILFPYWGIFVIPETVAYFILTYNIYWFYQSFQIATTGIVSHLRIQASMKFDWVGDLKNFPDWKKVKHVIIIPTYKEPLRILERTLGSIASQTLPKNQLIVVLATEKREPKEDRLKKVAALKKKFGDSFGRFYATTHPDSVLGEIAGKSSNERYAAVWFKKNKIDKGNYNIKHLVVTSCDADHLFHPNHFASLSYKFLDHPKRYKMFWQPAVLFYNNIWKLPAVTRVPNILGSIFGLSQLPRRDRLISTSNYSLSFKLLDEVGYWDADKIPEDWGIFFKSYYKKKGGVEVEPNYLPIYADAPESTSFFKTIKNQYEQRKRWAWGVSDDPWIIKNYFLTPGVPFFEKTMRVLYAIQSHFLWPVHFFIITIGLTLATLINPRFARTSLGYMVPKLSSIILTIALVFLGVMLILDRIYKPQRPKEYPLWRAIISPLEFVLMPVAGFLFSALPGLDAHTRLMLGKYIEYKVTEKV
jgi:cellulose synthase/poly-beta-1,6-N-acetylglucosamine synthase-like glycosyltransferase